MHNFSPEDLLLYLYKEASPQQAAALEEALKQDWTLREKLAVMKTAMERLNNLTVAPRTEVVLNVLKYAAAQQPVKTS
jgi:anti-sigma factor RsiW